MHGDLVSVHADHYISVGNSKDVPLILTLFKVSRCCNIRSRSVHDDLVSVHADHYISVGKSKDAPLIFIVLI